ncbi:hypothetical protein ONS95_010437 [Cadophora gregata]|uniref:uncharacterized protein n=1 Tax=Cadophora gregata TaxID=51156 RepID=UPI0026DCE9F6|nr:uncharacterized protein ONS95_010437 [Cadophora gregata]KAK0122179.1 hypothetical protein ONS95_010437 [Cadophora gregata]
MTLTNNEAGAMREWILDTSGRWTPNPAVNRVTTDMKLLLKSMERFDESWEFLGLETIRQLYYFIGESNDSVESPPQFNEGAFHVPDQDQEKVITVLGKLGVHQVSRDFSRTLKEYRKLLASTTRKQILRRFRKSPAKHALLEVSSVQFTANRLNTQLCYLTLNYFSRPLERYSKIRWLDIVRQIPVDRVSSLPVELRLQILETMSLAAMDNAFRSSFQDLIHLYLPTIQLKAKQWCTDLFSRNNFVYAGSSVIDLEGQKPCDVYRLRYPNLHPELQPRKYHPNHQPDATDSVWDTVQYPPSLSHAGMMLMDALEQILWHRSQPTDKIRNRDKIWRTNAHPRALAFYLEPFIFDERYNPISSIVDQDVEHRDSHLLIYQDELNLILNDLEPFLRPAFLKHRMTAKDHGKDESFAYIFPSPEYEKLVPTRPTHQTHKYGYCHMIIGNRICRGLWGVTSTKEIEQTDYTEDEWRRWWDSDRARQEAETEQKNERQDCKGSESENLRQELEKPEQGLGERWNEDPQINLSPDQLDLQGS